MDATIAIDRAWIVFEFLKVIAAERDSVVEAKARAEAPPDPALAVLYHEIAAGDERHVTVLETIATRYGHTPSRSEGGGVSAALGRFKDKVSRLGSSPSDLLIHDLLAKTEAIYWRIAWTHAFEAIGDTASTRELGIVLTEDEAHRDALLESLKRMVEQGARAKTAS